MGWIIITNAIDLSYLSDAQLQEWLAALMGLRQGIDYPADEIRLEIARAEVEIHIRGRS